MKCNEINNDPLTCNKIINTCEKIIMESGILSFSHTKVLQENICSSRKFYEYFKSREEIVICILLRRTITFDIERFLEDNQDLPVIAKLFVPILITLEVIRIDPVYQKIALTARNIGLWQVAHEDKQKRLNEAEHRFIKVIKHVVDLSIENKDIEADCSDQLTHNLYFYNLGRIMASGSIISQGKKNSELEMTQAKRLLGITDNYRLKDNISPELLIRLNKKIVKYFGGKREINCERCMYFKK
ncbi:hypothetical protein [Shewanella sp. WPAGA9]|uniref:hypothetical protein n=1 Tax=Shewanella sp. ENK2 TaxID=2775245 RepID=UPI00177BD18C|nr:hypothetical protein [Shewanella sp. WPAGA9]